VRFEFRVPNNWLPGNVVERAPGLEKLLLNTVTLHLYVATLDRTLILRRGRAARTSSLAIYLFHWKGTPDLGPSRHLFELQLPAFRILS
jgi:hypothetical protein